VRQLSIWFLWICVCDTQNKQARAPFIDDRFLIPEKKYKKNDED